MSGENLLVIKSFDRKRKAFKVPYIYASDIEGEPFQHLFNEDESGNVTCPLLEEPLFLNALWEAEGFGKLIATADNEGQGFRKDDFRVRSEVNLNYELARTHHRKVADAQKRLRKSGHAFSSSLGELLKEAYSLLEKARTASDDIEKAGFSDKSLSCSLWAGEKLALETAKEDIEKHRKADVTIRVVDENGDPIENVKVVASQGDHDVLFACNTRSDVRSQPDLFKKYEQRFRELFNGGMVNFFWPSFEPEEGKYIWESRDFTVNWLKSNGLKVWGHLLIWLHEWSVTDWAKQKSYGELKEVLRRLCREPVHRYRDTITLWNVFNEPEWGNVLDLSVDQQIELLELGLRVTKETSPEAVRMINPTIVWGEYAAWGRTAEGPAERRLLTPYQFFEEVEKRGIEYEAVGLQLYMGFGGKGSGFTVRDMFTVSELLDKYAGLGKPVHISEFAVPSRNVDDENAMSKGVSEAGYWHRPWDEKVQADWIEQFYTIAFSKPYIESITWFEMADYSRRFVPWGGLLNEDMSPKQSYLRLKKLLDSWMTRTEGTTSHEGVYKFRGFKGSYEISIEKDGKTLAEVDLYVEKDTTKKIRVMT